ncbi:hypothetical protein [Streptomyces smaragdinus]|uniref:hypothetical protein n=1 Tax=Streptomyces smaragdinus TaxID=2585196 RepID=UPI0012957DB8|nr:hypothetical protein [Streptomyces smaragdinus]
MRMSEGFAATAAAVAPVLWAIGTIEVQQIRKEWQSLSAVRVQRYNEAAVAISEAVDEESLAHAQGLWGAAQRWWTGQSAQFGLYISWLYLSVTMSGCTMIALRWLAENGGLGERAEAKPDDAQFVFWALASAFLFITVIPAWAVFRDINRFGKRVRVADRAVRQLNTEARARVQSRAVDPEVDERPRL